MIYLLIKDNILTTILIPKILVITIIAFSAFPVYAYRVLYISLKVALVHDNF